MRRVGKAAAGSAIIVAICYFVTPQEGLITRAYRDPANILTICIGETEGVKPGDVKTKAECQEMLAKRLPTYLQAVDESVDKPMPDNRRIALTDFAYNCGIRCYQKSSIPKLLNAGKVTEACNKLSLYVWAGNPKRKLPGLVKRREKERQLCLSS